MCLPPIRRWSAITGERCGWSAFRTYRCSRKIGCNTNDAMPTGSTDRYARTMQQSDARSMPSVVGPMVIRMQSRACSSDWRYPARVSSGRGRTPIRTLHFPAPKSDSSKKSCVGYLESSEPFLICSHLPVAKKWRPERPLSLLSCHNLERGRGGAAGI